ncbi:adenosine deaminase 2 [Orussus abietinus]|uniref:adenosine deaminase 2 n=1 Tax=Orussus abietinus TaxID=222816 RepID=UPI000625A808|nr:adenosine deaminase 2 [Orussus abietinus]
MGGLRLAFLFGFANLVVATPVDIFHGYGRNDYWERRAELISDERSRELGSDIVLRDDELQANRAFMKLKLKELDDAFLDPSKFLPAHNFIAIKSKIETSEVFKILKDMPKGAMLHAHDFALVSWDYLFENVTYRKDLFMCDVNGRKQFKFFSYPDKECDWRLLSALRKNATSLANLNREIMEEITMKTDDPDKTYYEVDSAWEKCQRTFGTIIPMLSYRPVFEDFFYQALLEHYEDNILYIEFRAILTPLYDLDGEEYGPLDVVKIMKTVTERFVRDHPDFVGARVIYAPSRLVDNDQLLEYLTIAKNLTSTYPSFVAGFDLVGQEDKGKPLSYFANDLSKLSDGIKYFFHAGETDWYGTSTDQNVVDAVLLNTTRIGHGYALLKHPKILEIARKKDIPIEVNPISNQVLGFVRDLRNHPASMFFANGYPIVISNDDPGMWGAKGLSYDFYEAFIGIMSRDADLKALKKLAMNSINYSSMTETEKLKAFDIWERKWNAFIAYLNIRDNSL